MKNFKTGWLLSAVMLAAPMSTNAMGQVVMRYVKAGGTGNGLTNFANASGDLQAMINASDGVDDEVWVAAGTYKPTVEWTTGTRSKTFRMRPGVKIYGGFQGLASESSLSVRNPVLYQTILSGDLDGDDTGSFGNRSDNCYHVVRAESVNPCGDISPCVEAITNTAQLDGFIVKGGNANGSGADVWGGGILVRFASPVIQNCVFIDNSGTNGGAGHVDGLIGLNSLPEAQPQFRSCTIIANVSADEAGGFCNRYGEPTFVNCVFNTNTAGGEGGAIYNTLGTAGGTTLTVINCTFTNNSASDGGAIYNGNIMTLRNSILWDDSATSNAEVRHGPTETITACNIEGDSSTLNQNPLFFDAAGGDTLLGTLDDNLRLDPASPCRNQGVNNDVPLDQWDVDNDGVIHTGSPTEATPDRDRAERILNTNVDMGAYEAHTASTCCADISPYGGNGCVNVNDLLAVINSWGFGGVADIHPECSGNGVVNVDDLLAVINGWGTSGGCSGPCSEADMPTTVSECMAYCSNAHPGDQEAYTACVNDCVDALCKADLIDCD